MSVRPGQSGNSLSHGGAYFCLGGCRAVLSNAERWTEIRTTEPASSAVIFTLVQVYNKGVKEEVVQSSKGGGGRED